MEAVIEAVQNGKISQMSFCGAIYRKIHVPNEKRDLKDFSCRRNKNFHFLTGQSCKKFVEKNSKKNGEVMRLTLKDSFVREKISVLLRKFDLVAEMYHS